MTPQHEEAERFLRLAKRDQTAFTALLSAAAVDPAVAFFHAQQAAEKALKAVMCLRGLEYRRTHDLEELAGMLSDVGVVPPVDERDLRCLTPLRRRISLRRRTCSPDIRRCGWRAGRIAACLGSRRNCQ